MRISLLFVTAYLLLSGCGREKQTSGSHNAHQALYHEVMDIHDEVMPRMDELYKLKQQLKSKLENATAADQERLQNKMHLIDSATRSMMDWMHLFRPEEYKGDSLRLYLERERERINEVKELMLRALQEGRAEIQKNPQ
jgi:hypothetical protein